MGSCHTEVKHSLIVPESFRQSLEPAERLIIIDDVQKPPAPLDEVTATIDRPETQEVGERICSPDIAECGRA